MVKKIVFLILCFVIVTSVISYRIWQTNNEQAPIIEIPISDQEQQNGVLPVVGTFNKLKELLKEDDYINVIDEAGVSSNLEKSTTNDFSVTNTQVQGVDESDIIKTDGEYIFYKLINRIVIVDARDTKQLKIASEIEYDSKFYPNEIYLSENQLIVIGTNYNNSKILCYNVTDKEKPVLTREIEIAGYLITSRMINNNIYLVSNKYAYVNLEEDLQKTLPTYKDTAISKENIVIPLDKIYYFPECEYSQYLLISSFNIKNTEEVNVQTYLGGASNVYCSTDNLYVVSQKSNYNNLLRDMLISTGVEIISESEIIKFNLNGSNIEYVAKSLIPGTILNQFSMDEYEENFRIATTANDTNNLYILDKNLNIISKIEGLANGEKIYSVRFMGKKAYIVTFKRVDPLFVIDVSNAYNPKVLGELKIPGYSDYLHPYDENYLIGFGRDTTTETTTYGEITLTSGMKMALFDVTNPENPIEINSVIIGEQGTYSELLNNHKALLFSKEKNLIAFPITVYESSTISKNYTKATFQGALVYGLDVKDGFKERYRISNVIGSPIKRIIYIDNTLFAISDNLIKAIDLTEMKYISELGI